MLRGLHLPIVPEQGNVAVAFMDLKGSSQIVASLSDEELKKTLDAWFSAICGVFRAYGGSIRNKSGDWAVVVLPGTESEQNPLSQALFMQWGTKLHYEPEGENALADRLEHIVASLKRQGETVYVMHPGGSNSIGALSYVSAFHEILDFSHRSGIHFSHVIHSTSSAGTQAGLVVGQCIINYETQIIGISASLKASAQTERISKLAWSTAQMIGSSIDPTKIIVDDGFVGPGYALPSKEGENAVKLFARLEGILLDPVYTGKAAAALLDYSENGRFKNGNVLFIHTGGNAGVYY